MNEETFICTQCYLEKPVSEFYAHRNSRGHRSECKECWRLRNIRYSQRRGLPRKVPLLEGRELRCSRCKAVKDSSLFHTDTSSKTGKRRICAECARKAWLSYAAKNRNNKAAS